MEQGADAPSVKKATPRLMVQSGHNGSIKVLAWSPDGKLLATGSIDNTLRLWDRNGTLINIMKQDSDVVSLAFSQDGTVLAAGSGSGDFEKSDNTVRLWDTTGKLIRKLVGHTADVKALAFRPGDSILATGSDDSAVRLWDKRGNLVKVLSGHTGGVEALAFSPDGKWLVSASRDGTARVWDRQGDLKKILRGHTEGISALVLSPDGRRLATGSWDKTVRLWDQRGNSIAILSGHTDAIYSLAFSPDGSLLASGSSDNTVRIWDRSGKQVNIIKGTISGVNAIAFSPDGALLYTGSYDDNPLNIWDTQGNLVRRLLGTADEENQTVYALAFSPDGSTLGSGSEDRVLRLWDRQGNLLKASSVIRYIRALAISPDGSMLSVVSTDGVCHVWDLTGRHLRAIDAGNGEHHAFGPDGAMLAYGRDDGVVRFQDRQGNPGMTLAGHAGRVAAVAFSPDASVLATGSADKTVRFWDREGKLIKILEGHTGTVDILKFSPDGTMLAAMCGDDSIRLWDGRGTLIAQLRIPDDGINRDNMGFIPRNLVFSPDSAILAFSKDNTLISLWYKNKNSVKTVKNDSDVTALAFSPESNTLASASTKNIRFWDRQGNLLKTMVGHTNIICTIAFNPDGSTLASGSWDGSIRLWDRDGNAKQVIEGYVDRVDSLVFTPDGATLVTAGDNTVRLWDAKTGLLRTALLAFNTGDWFTITGDGYWDGSRDGGRYAAMVKGMEAFGVDQFAIRNNRPDIILERLKSNDKDAISNYKGQYDRRIKKLRKIYNIKESDLSGEYHVPVAKIRDSGTHDPAGKWIAITADLSDDRYNLIAYNIYVNDVPLYRGFGPTITGTKKTITEKIELTEGDNKIEVSCLNEMGVESYRGRVFASYQRPQTEPAVAKPKLYYIGFGVSRYALPGKIKSREFKRALRRLKGKKRAELRDLYAERDIFFLKKDGLSKQQEERLRVLLDRADLSLDLKYAHQDVLDLAETFKMMEGKEYSEVIVKPYINEQVTPEAIKDAKEILKNASVDDTFVLFISGHGVHDQDKEATYYYLTSNADLGNLAGTAAPFETVEDLMQDIRPRKKLFFMDTCESGELDDTKMNSVIVATKDSKGVRARSIRKRSVDQGEAASTPKRAFLLEKERYIYNDLFRRSGAIVHSSCQGNEVSYEHDSLKNGFFTAAIKRGIREGKADANRDNAISTDELRDFVAKEVPAICRELKIREHAIQHPTVDRDNLFMKLAFPAVQ